MNYLHTASSTASQRVLPASLFTFTLPHRHKNLLQLHPSLSFSSTKKNHYDILGITPKASPKQVKEAYFRLSKVYHPDVNIDDKRAQLKFQAISDAYETLSNVHLRKEYDKTLGRQRIDHESFKVDKPRQPRQEFTGKTPIYDFDEWLHKHYEEFYESKKKRNIKEDVQEIEEVDVKRVESFNRKFISGTLLFAVITWGVYLYQTVTLQNIDGVKSAIKNSKENPSKK